MTSDPNGDRIEYPRGEIEIIAPGDEPRRRRSPFEFEGASARRTYTFRAGASGFLGFLFAAVVAGALFVFIAGFFAVAVAVTIAAFAGFALRNKLRQWIGR